MSRKAYCDVRIQLGGGASVAPPTYGSILYQYNGRGNATGLTSSIRKLGVTKINDTGGIIDNVRLSFALVKIGAPTGTIIGEIYAATTGSPLQPLGDPGTPLAIAPETYSMASLPTTYPTVGTYNVVFTFNGLSLAAGSSYTFVYGYTTTALGGSDFVPVSRDSVSPIASAHQTSYTTSGTNWDTNAAWDIEALIEYD